MLIVGLDTTTRAGSVAVVRDQHVLGVASGDGRRTHAERLPDDVLGLLERLGLALTDVDVFAVAAGPGSFTGLRIGIAAIQGLAFAMSRPVVAVSALEALASATWSADAAATTAPLAVWMDAQRGEVFSAVYRLVLADRYSDVVADPQVESPPQGHATEAAARAPHDQGAGVEPAAASAIGAGASRVAEPEFESDVARQRRPPLGDDAADNHSGSGFATDNHSGSGFEQSTRRIALPDLELIDPGAVATPEATLERWSTERWAPGLSFVGDGALRYRDVLTAAGWQASAIVDPVPPLAPAVALMAEGRARRGDATRPHAIRPIYIRRPDAELARDRRQAG